MTEKMHRIVIIGAGFAGLRTAIEIDRRRARIGSCSITVIDKQAEHIYTPLLYEVSAGELEKESGTCVGELRSGACVPLDAYTNILKTSRIKFLRGEVSGIDHKKKEVKMKKGESIPFDAVVIAVGSEVATYGIEGVKEHALTMKTMQDALGIRQRLFEFLQAVDHEKEKRLTVVVGGAGATGSEFAAELSNFFERLVRHSILRPEEYSITLVEAGKKILGPFHPSMQKTARRRLEKLGVKVRTETEISRVMKGSVAWKNKKTGKESVEEADVVVWTAGIRPMTSTKQLHVPLNKEGYVEVESTLQVKGMKNYFALGDCVFFPHPRSGARVPALAQAAVQAAKTVAENVTRQAKGKPLVPWEPPEKWLTIIPLGGKYGIADFGAFRVSGILVYVFRKIVDLRYFLSILSVRDALRLWSNGAKVYIRND